MEFGFEDLVAQVEREGGSPAEQLRTATAKSKEVAAMADALMDHFVEKGRAAGMTWAEIGEVLRVSKQAAQQRAARAIRDMSSQVTDKIRSAVKGGMFHRFTDRARSAIELAQAASKEMRHEKVGTEHLLLGLFGAGGVGARALETVGVTQAAAREAVEARLGRGTKEPGHVPFTPNAKKVLERSLREALQLGHNYIGTEHLLLALSRGDPDSVSVQILDEAGVDLGVLRHQIVQILSTYGKPAPGEGQAHQA